MEVSPELRDRLARSRERARSYRCPVDRGSLVGSGTDGQIYRVEVVHLEPILDRTILYLRVERSVPVRHVTSLVDLAATHFPGTRGTATFRVHPGRPGSWEFDPAPAPGAGPNAETAPHDQFCLR